jgi:hypothetical protein
MQKILFSAHSAPVKDILANTRHAENNFFAKAQASRKISKIFLPAAKQAECTLTVSHAEGLLKNFLTIVECAPKFLGAHSVINKMANISLKLVKNRFLVQSPSHLPWWDRLV